MKVSNKPKDLGVSFTSDDLKSARAKTGTGMNIESLQIVNGSFRFKGTLPDVARSK